MAKKFVRGVTGIDDIETFDKSLTNVNDLLSDGQNTYVHTKKGKNEFYYNITNAVNEIQSSDNTLTITKENDTVSISNSGLATKQELATKENTLSVDYGISKTSSGNTTKLGFEYTYVSNGFDLNNLTNGNVRGYNLTNAPHDNKWYYVSSFGDENYTIQDVILLTPPNTAYRRVRDNGVWQSWHEQIGDKSVIDDMLSQKQNTITNNTSIGALSNNQLIQLYCVRNTYTHANGFMKTYVKNVAVNTNVNAMLEEFNFSVKINQNSENIVVTLDSHDTSAFNTIMTKYGSNNTVSISGCVFTLSGSSLTVSTTNNTNQNYVITFSDILD